MPCLHAVFEFVRQRVSRQPAVVHRLWNHEAASKESTVFTLNETPLSAALVAPLNHKRKSGSTGLEGQDALTVFMVILWLANLTFVNRPVPFIEKY
jgi:hypothetical protein